MAPKNAKGGFYAVRVGRRPGIYFAWAECEAQVKAFPGAEFQKFPNTLAAEQYMKGDSSSSSGATSSDQVQKPETMENLDTKGKKRSRSTVFATVEDESTWDVVYSDGACKGNGKAASVAGIGVWWGPNDHRNIAERCPGDQTNNRAELIAILRVLEETPISKRPLLIRTDSQYSIKCFQEWLPNWIRNGWMNAKKEPVKNAGIIRLISAHLDHRARLGQQIRLSYVKGHSGDVGNDGADAEANKGTLLPVVEERDWAKAENELRQKVDPDVNPSNMLELAHTFGEDAVDITPPMASPKRKRANPSPPPLLPQEGNERAGLKMPTLPSKAKPSATRAMLARSNRLAAIEGALKMQNSSSEMSSLPPCSSDRDQGSFVQRASVSSSTPVSEATVKNRAPRDGVAHTEVLQSIPKPASKQPASNLSVPTAIPKSPLRVIYALPPIVSARQNDLNLDDYTDCLLSDEDLANEI